MTGSTFGTVERVVGLMRALAEAGGDVTIKSLSRSLDLPPSTIHRLLAILIRLGIVDRGQAAHSYCVSVEFYRLGALVVGQLGVRDLALPFMQTVAKDCGEVCLLFRYLPASRKVMVEASVDALHPLRYSISEYTPMSVLWGASGRAVLAYLDDAEVAAVLADDERSPVAGLAPPTAAELGPSLADIRARGHVVTSGQKIAGAVGIAAGVLDGDGRPFGSLCVTVPQVRFRPETTESIAASVTAQAKALSAALGYRGDREIHAGVRAHG